jgi:hypothetical protein
MVGHDNRSRDGRPLTMVNARGGRAVFLDTGAGKGGALAWQDLSFDDALAGGPADQPGAASAH